MGIEEQLFAAIGEHRGSRAADQLCEACVVLFSVDAAAISLVFDGANRGTLGASSAAARNWDELQFTLGEGPCLDSVAQRKPLLVVDLADPDENRWPAFGPAMVSNHIRGVSALPVLVAGEYLGALGLFRTGPGLLGDEHLTGALVAAELAEMPMLDLMGSVMAIAGNEPYSDAWAELNSLSRAEVSQATGMLVAQLDIDSAAALLRLRAHAYATGRSVTDIARDILDRKLRLEPD